MLHMRPSVRPHTRARRHPARSAGCWLTGRRRRVRSGHLSRDCPTLGGESKPATSTALATNVSTPPSACDRFRVAGQRAVRHSSVRVGRSCRRRTSTRSLRRRCGRWRRRPAASSAATGPAIECWNRVLESCRTARSRRRSTTARSCRPSDPWRSFQPSLGRRRPLCAQMLPRAHSSPCPASDGTQSPQARSRRESCAPQYLPPSESPARGNELGRRSRRALQWPCGPRGGLFRLRRSVKSFFGTPPTYRLERPRSVELVLTTWQLPVATQSTMLNGRRTAYVELAASTAVRDGSELPRRTSRIDPRAPTKLDRR